MAVPARDPRLDLAVICVMGPILFPILARPLLNHLGLRIQNGNWDVAEMAARLAAFTLAGIRTLPVGSAGEDHPRRDRPAGRRHS